MITLQKRKCPLTSPFFTTGPPEIQEFTTMATSPMETPYLEIVLDKTWSGQKSTTLGSSSEHNFSRQMGSKDRGNGSTIHYNQRNVKKFSKNNLEFFPSPIKLEQERDGTFPTLFTETHGKRDGSLERPLCFNKFYQNVTKGTELWRDVRVSVWVSDRF